MNNLPPDYIEPEEHCQECEDQPAEATECICLEVKERKMEDEADARIHDVDL